MNHMVSASAAVREESLNPDDLINLFNTLFQAADNTVLVRGKGEPIYLPADDNNACHRIEFAHGYFASALHEIAHWCIAGKERRLLTDYGYWYAPDGRDENQQRAFESVEVKPQALEWIFSKACNKQFQISVDNLGGTDTDPTPFKRAVYQQVMTYCSEGIPARAASLVAALTDWYGTADVLAEAAYSPSEIGLSSTLAEAQV